MFNSRKRRGAAGGVGVAAVVLAISLFTTSAPSTTSAATTFTASADTYVKSDQPDTAFGTGTTVRIDGSPVVRALMRFVVTGVTGVTAVSLRVWANSALSAGYDVTRIASTTWPEATTTWNNQPAVGTKIASSGAVAAGSWTQVNLTGYVTGNGVWSIGLSTASTTALSLASRESGANAPQLVVTGGSASPSPSRSASASSSQAATAPATARPSTAASPSSGASPTLGPPAPTPSASPVPGSVVIAAAGDISCESGSGTASCDQMGTANLIKSINPAYVLSLGDNQYESGTATAFNNQFNPSWGQFKGKIKPAIGNHEYLTSGASGYFGYFGAAAGPAGKAYYSYDIGAWHILSINSECSHIGGCAAGNPEEVWVKNDLADNPTPCVLAYWHEPRWSNGQHGNATQMTAIWNDLVAAHADVVLSGHNHDYERYAEMDAAGKPVSQGVREFVVGTGGKNHYAISSPMQVGEQVQNDKTFGVLKMTLSDGSYTWSFVPAATYSFTDSGSGTC